MRTLFLIVIIGLTLLLTGLRAINIIGLSYWWCTCPVWGAWLLSSITLGNIAMYMSIKEQITEARRWNHD